MMRKRRAGGFTLVELVVVIAILGILATLAITMIGNIEKVSAEKVSIANLQATTRGISTFLAMNDRSGLNNLDALIDYQTAAGAVGTFNYTLNSLTSPGGVYRGVKQYYGVPVASSTDPAAAKRAAMNKGIHSDLAGKVCVYYLTGGNVTALKALGLNSTYQHNYGGLHPQTEFPSGGVVGGPGFRVESTACFPMALATGTAVLAVAPRAGAAIYKSFGQDLKLTNAADNATAESAANASGWYLMLFGLGDQASIIGNRQGGLDSTPRSATLGTDYYRQYLVAIRVPTTPDAFDAEFAGLLDPKGRTVKDARFDNDWRNGVK